MARLRRAAPREQHLRPKCQFATVQWRVFPFVTQEARAQFPVAGFCCSCEEDTHTILSTLATLSLRFTVLNLALVINLALAAPTIGPRLPPSLPRHRHAPSPSASTTRPHEPPAPQPVPFALVLTPCFGPALFSLSLSFQRWEATPQRFEPLRAGPSGFLTRLRRRSDTVSRQ